MRICEYNIRKEVGPMNGQCRFSHVTKEYLKVFFCILNEMIRGMTEVKLTDSISHNLIMQMIPHHEAAIKMSNNILKYTTDISLQGIALQVITEQTKSIENMRSIVKHCGELNNEEHDLCAYNKTMRQIMQTMFSRMRCAQITNSINCNFMWEMIPHHEGAVEMAKNALEFDICCELRPILQSIIVSQQCGIKQMQELLRCLGC